MSKFFKEESSSSYESESSSGSEESFTYDSEDEAQFLSQQQSRLPQKYVKGGVAGAGDSDSDSGDEGKRGAKSQKQKMWEDVFSAGKAIRQVLEDYQWQVVYNGK